MAQSCYVATAVLCKRKNRKDLAGDMSLVVNPVRIANRMPSRAGVTFRSKNARCGGEAKSEKSSLNILECPFFCYVASEPYVESTAKALLIARRHDKTCNAVGAKCYIYNYASENSRTSAETL
jgi:hypothetical protein